MENLPKRPEILIHATLKQEIARELNTTNQTVMMSVKYVNNSKLGRSIRKKAQQKLIQEASKVAY